MERDFSKRFEDICKDMQRTDLSHYQRELVQEEHDALAQIGIDAGLLDIMCEIRDRLTKIKERTMTK